jgi:citrate lyase beta subunit
MIKLPHALLDASTGPASPVSGCRVLVGAGAAWESAADSRFLVVDSAAGLETLHFALRNGVAGIALAGWRTGADIQRLAVLLSVAEAEGGRIAGSTAILAMTDGILPAPLSPHGLSDKSGRLAALVWDQRGLMQTLGTKRALTDDGAWTSAFAAARAAVLLTAAAAGVPAYDSVSNLTGEAFAIACERSRDDGFFGRLAEDQVQASIIPTIYRRGASSDQE